MTAPRRFSHRPGPPFQRHLRIEMGIGPNKEGIARIEIDREIHWGSRWVHGGVFTTLVDVASGIAISNQVPGAPHSIEGTIEMKVNFLRRAREGDLTATARSCTWASGRPSPRWTS